MFFFGFFFFSNSFEDIISEPGTLDTAGLCTLTDSDYHGCVGEAIDFGHTSKHPRSESNQAVTGTSGSALLPRFQTLMILIDGMEVQCVCQACGLKRGSPTNHLEERNSQLGSAV